MDKPYGFDFRSLEASGAVTCWTLKYPAACRLTGLKVTQVGGVTATDFRVEIYCAEHACSTDGGSESSGGADPDGQYSASPQHYRIGEPMTNDGSLDSAGHLERSWDSPGLAYANRDHFSVTKFNAPMPAGIHPRIYVRIIIDGGAGDTTWDVTIESVVRLGR